VAGSRVSRDFGRSDIIKLSPAVQVISLRSNRNAGITRRWRDVRDMLLRETGGRIGYFFSRGRQDNQISRLIEEMVTMDVKVEMEVLV
jgi:hypothetical protein